ncbi:MAG: Hint domain-containing protein [Pseudomonadota bacterium]
MPTTWNALFLGIPGTDLDNFEGDAIADNASAIVGQTFGSAGAPLSEEVVSVTAIDNDGDNNLGTDNSTFSDQVQFDLGDGAGVETNLFDSIAVYDATLTYDDGTTANISAVVFQDANGNLFLAPEFAANTDSAAMEAKPIESLTLNFLLNNNSNMFADRFVTDFVCFATGTAILTPDGPRPVEALKPGDLVDTLDHGPQRLLWHGARRLDFAAADASQKPIEIKPGALGSDRPSRPLVVSPQHRVLLQTPQGDGLALAKGLLPAPGVRRMEGRREVTYHTLLFDQHEIIFAEGLAVETFFPGPFALGLLSPVQRLALLAHFPGLLEDPVRAYGPPVRRIMSRREAEEMARTRPLRQPSVFSNQWCA